MNYLNFAKYAALVFAGGLSQGVFAGDGTINFTGAITDSPCSISASSQSLHVPLGKITRTALTGAVGTKATPSMFNIELRDCGATAKGATVTFMGPADSVTKDDLAVGAGEVSGSFATGVAIELDDSAGTKIPLGTPSGTYSLAQGNNSLKFQAAYVKTVEPVTPGNGNATAQFTVSYN